MATNLPNFPTFVIQSDGGQTENTAGVRWKKWMDKFDNMLRALDIKDDKRKKAMLLHYCGEEVYDIFDSFSDTDKGIGATRDEISGEGTVKVPDEYNKLCESLKNYFTPKRNLSFEVYKFRQAKQEAGESIDSFYTRLRTLANTCEFHNKDNEILSQIIQGCTSSRTRRRALRDNYTLNKLIEEARALEISESRAAVMEHTRSVNVVQHARMNNSHSHNTSYSSTKSGGSRGHGVFRGRGACRGRGASRGRGTSGRSSGNHGHSRSELCRNC